MSEFWKKCAVCKKEIGLSTPYQKCSISTCRKHVFCSVDCWAVHDSVMGHKSAYAEEELSPASAEMSNSSGKPKRRIIASTTPAHRAIDLPQDTLIVISKLKNYVKAKSGMNTSGDVADELSDYIRTIVDFALDEAHKEGRKTLMARDFKNIEIR